MFIAGESDTTLISRVGEARRGESERRLRLVGGDGPLRASRWEAVGLLESILRVLMKSGAGLVSATEIGFWDRGEGWMGGHLATMHRRT